MGAATLPEALRAIVKVLLVDCFQQPRHRSLDNLILERGLADRTLPPVFLLNPDAFHGCCLRASAPQTLVQVAQVGVEVLGILLRRDPIDACGARLARVAVRLPQKVLVDQVSQRPKHASGIAGRLLCNLLEFRCDGWGSHRISRRSRVPPVTACPALRPRWCPRRLPERVEGCCLPATGNRRLSPRSHLEGYPGVHDYTHCGAPSRGLHPRYPRLRTAPCGDARGFATDVLARLSSGGT